MSGNVIRGSSGTVAVSSMFGWVLSGPTSVEESGRWKMEDGITSLIASDSF